MVDKIAYPVQLLQPDGRRVLRPEYTNLVRDIGPDELRALYEDLVVTRRIDVEATALQRQGELGLWAPMLGQEAAQVGSARALRPDDYAFVSYREHAVAYCRGVDPAEMTRMWRGTAHSGWDPHGVKVTNPAIVVGSQGLHATGYAMGAHLDGAEIATIAYFGDGATSQGDIAEALGFSMSFNAPVVFFCQNNQWAISEPVHLQSPVPIAQRAAGYGCRPSGWTATMSSPSSPSPARPRSAHARGAAPPSSKPSPTGWVPIRPPTTPRGTGLRRRPRNGRPAIRSTACTACSTGKACSTGHS